MISHRLAEVAEGMNHALHFAAVVVHIEVALDKDSEHGVEVECACRGIIPQWQAKPIEWCCHARARCPGGRR
jgi:hypothetical protein